MKREKIESKIVKFIKCHQELTPEQIKKCVTKTFPKEKFYNEDIERLMSMAWSEMREEREDDGR